MSIISQCSDELRVLYEVWEQKPKSYQTVNPYPEFFAGRMLVPSDLQGIKRTQEHYRLRQIAFDWLRDIRFPGNAYGYTMVEGEGESVGRLVYTWDIT